MQISADNGVFGQTGPKVGSFDAGYGSTQMVRLIGQKKAREMWFLARLYSAQEALQMGLVNTVCPLRFRVFLLPHTTTSRFRLRMLRSAMQVVPLAELEGHTLQWCREIMRNSPTAIRALKAAMNAAEDGQAGIQELGHNLTLMFYNSEEGKEGREAYKARRAPDFGQFPRLP